MCVVAATCVCVCVCLRLWCCSNVYVCCSFVVAAMCVRLWCRGNVCAWQCVCVCVAALWLCIAATKRKANRSALHQSFSSLTLGLHELEGLQALTFPTPTTKKQQQTNKHAASLASVHHLEMGPSRSNFGERWWVNLIRCKRYVGGVGKMSLAADRPSHAGIMTEDISNVTETSCNTMIVCTVRNSCTITDYMRGHLRQRET